MAVIEIKGIILKVLKEYFTDNVAHVKIGNKLSEPIKVTKGLSHILFHIYLENSGSLEEELLRNGSANHRK